MRELPYRRLHVWAKAHELGLAVLELAEKPPISRAVFLRDQMCSSAMSVPANIAEGSGRGTSVDFAGFLDRARGSLFELDMWLYTTQRRGWLSDEDYDVFAEQIHEVNAMLFALRDTLRSRNSPARRNL